MRSLLVVLVACSSARPTSYGDDAPDVDASIDVDAAPDAGGDGGVDAPTTVDTCVPPTGAFATDLPPSPGANTTRRRAVLQVSNGAVRAFTSDLYQNGSFFDANIIQHARGANGWTQGPIANGGIGLSIGRSMATTSECIAYSFDYDGTLHLKCAGAGDRTLAPRIAGALAIAVHGTDEHLVYEDGSSALVHMRFDGDPGPPTTIHPNAWVYGPTSLAVDSAGNLHLAYVTIEPPPSGGSVGTRAVRYATRQGTTWTTEVVDTDTWRGSSEEADTVSLALVANKPVIAYHKRATRSLHVAERTASGFALRMLLAPDPAFSNDAVGMSVAIASDCMGRVHVVYQRSLTTDAAPNLRLAYAQITANGLEHRQMLPLTASTAYAFGGNRHGLGFVVGADGKQYVAAQLNSIYGSGLYIATR